MLAFNAGNIAEFRASGGTISSFGDAPVLLLSTVGVKSARSRVNPLMYLADPDNPRRVFVFASAAGADANPAWLTNLVANHDVTVEIGSERLLAKAEVLAEPERARTFATQAARYPGFAAYQAKTRRRIPVVALSLRANVPNLPSSSEAPSAPLRDA